MEGVTIMLIPDSDYIAARPDTTDHHLTVAYFGNVSDLNKNGIRSLRTTVEVLAQSTDPIPGKANGVGIFNAGNDGYAVVDLIDGIGSFRVRQQLERLYGSIAGMNHDFVQIDYTHGFTPHITREYVERNVFTQLTPADIDGIEFTFTAVGLWFGDQRYEISL